MNVTEYQTIIKQTAVYPPNIGVLYCALGLCGESGEVSEKIKKLYRDSPWLVEELNMSKVTHGLAGDRVVELEKHVDSEAMTNFKQSLSKEIGDVIWYCTALASEFNISLEEVLRMNYEKLLNRRATNTLNGSGDNRELKAAI